MSDELTPAHLAWNRFADRLKEIGNTIVGPLGARSARERADGFRYLTSLIAAGYELEMAVDRKRPAMVRMFTPIRSFVGEDPDALYHDAKLDPAHDYVFTVERGDDIFFSIVVYASDDEGLRSIGAYLIDEDIVYDDHEQTKATIAIGPERPEGAKNWLKLDGIDPFIMTRQYFPEPVTEVDAGKYRQALMDIRCTAEVGPPPMVSEEQVASGLQRLLAFLSDTLDAGLGVSALTSTSTIAYDEDESSTPTRIGKDGQQVIDEERYDPYTADEVIDMIDPRVIANNLPGPGIGYSGVSYKLADDEVIVISAKNVPCRYWSCQVFDHYLRAGDYRHYPVALNDRQVVYDDDGSFRIYASAENPSVKNWICTEGHRRGQVVLRTLLAEADLDPEMKVLKVSEIPETDRL